MNVVLIAFPNDLPFKPLTGAGIEPAETVLGFTAFGPVKGEAFKASL